MITWGIVANSHDASIAVFKGDELRWAGLSKDFSKIPNDGHLNKKLVRRAARLGKPTNVIWYERPFLKTIRQFYAGQGWLAGENNIPKYLSEHGISGMPIKYTQHHESHAAYAYYTQPEDNCAVICLDSIGEFETLTIWHGKNSTLKKVYSQGYPHSLGLFYSAMTQRVGLQAQRDEYLIAQWGAKGDKYRLFSAMLKEIVSIQAGPSIKMRENMHRGLNWWKPELTSEQDMYDIAAATQAVFEHCLHNLSAWTQQYTGSKHLALAGGGALNRQAVDLIRPNWTNVHVPQNPGDPGSCIGAVLAKTKTRITLDKQWQR